MRSSLQLILLFAVVFACATAGAEAPGISPSCKTTLNATLPGWQPATASPEVSAWAKQQGFNPVAGTGDFDGDGRRDQAVLVDHAGQRKLAVCLAAAAGTRLIVIDKPYCSDYLRISKAHSKHYNIDADRMEVIQNDGISVVCFETAGATYLYDGRTFQPLVDSD